jgi:hypothetical protein
VIGHRSQSDNADSTGPSEREPAVVTHGTRIIDLGVPVLCAIGAFGAGGGVSSDDSTYFSAFDTAKPAPAPSDDLVLRHCRWPVGYLSDVDPNDPLAYPVVGSEEFGLSRLRI